MPYIHNPHTGLPEWFDQSAIDLLDHIKATARKLTEGARAMCPTDAEQHIARGVMDTLRDDPPALIDLTLARLLSREIQRLRVH